MHGEPHCTPHCACMHPYIPCWVRARNHTRSCLGVVWHPNDCPFGHKLHPQNSCAVPNALWRLLKRCCVGITENWQSAPNTLALRLPASEYPLSGTLCELQEISSQACTGHTDRICTRETAICKQRAGEARILRQEGLLMVQVEGRGRGNGDRGVTLASGGGDCAMSACYGPEAVRVRAQVGRQAAAREAVLLLEEQLRLGVLQRELPVHTARNFNGCNSISSIGRTLLSRIST